MKYLHTMVRVTDIEQSLRFYRDASGSSNCRASDYPKGRYHARVPGGAGR